jgi:hypothetical protein
VYFYTRPGGRCPSRDFYQGCEAKTRKKFEASFEALVKVGSKYENQQRFRPLSGRGQPLWEFKEFDHRIYCARQAHENGSVQIVLLSGWVKDKAGKTAEENNQIQGAQTLYQERMNEGAKK